MTTNSIQPPSLLNRLLESRAIPELYAFAWAYPFLRLAPRGDNHPVLVLPGFLADGRSTAPLRYILNRFGYKGHRWKLGRNFGPASIDFDHVLDRMQELRNRYDRRVSIIGWSLGGVYARELAWAAPDDVRQIITLGTPLIAHEKTRANKLFRFINSPERTDYEREVLKRLAEPTPVPSTSIYSRSDGVVPWQCSLEKTSPTTENIRVYGSHLGLGHNPSVVWAILDRLSQAAGEWRPFNHNLCRVLSYPKPDSLDE